MVSLYFNDVPYTFKFRFWLGILDAVCNGGGAGVFEELRIQADGLKDEELDELLKTGKVKFVH